MKRLFIPILTLILALACTPDNGGEQNGNNNNNNGGYVPTGKITVKGLVYGGASTTLAGVVVSDGLLCVQTDETGYFEIDSDLSRTKFITASIPSGYMAPTNENGLPIFYHQVTDEERKKDMVQHTFEFLPINNNPERYTLIVGADPQPRQSGAGFDNIAYHALDMCEDFYRDMKEKAATINDRNVYGMMLGDIVHEDMKLYSNYVAGLKTLGFPMFNILGNHDNDYTAKNDTEGRRKYEEYLGPTYYSFNIGKQHYVVLDNLIMKLRSSDNSLRDYDQGLTDEVWQWLQNDLAYVDRSTTIMVAAHSPMFMGDNMSERSKHAQGHRSDYANLFSKFAKVHAWAGHSHTTFNYVYPESSDLKNLEVHTVARSTGELWTNEYIANGTPRGYTVVEVDGDDISWYFKPTIYQRNGFTGKTSPQPEYKYRDYDFDENGVAKMRKDGSTLSDKYQMKVYKPGEYHKTYKDMLNGKAADKSYIYVNVFLWDDKWEKPKYNGVTMTKVGYKDAYELSDYEIKNHYYSYGYKLAGGSDYGPADPTDNVFHTLFRAYEPNSKGKGTITVVDRFGNEYSQSISW
ncbi:MAG: calcineurin-like phosphoesterase C-terminal domain-containing protein [Alistipes sp.]|nr:calcineurin-like phosphoesterase C-terminal domain-containing protein [Alistipes sp.]